MRSSKRRHKKRSRSAEAPVPYFSLFCLLAIVFLATAMLSFASADWPNPHVYPHLQPVHNACGKVGAWLAYHSTRLVGWGAYPLMIFIGAGAFLRITRGPIDLLWQRIGGVLVLATVTSSAVEILRPAAALNLPSGYGGALGQLFGGLLHHYFNGFGTFLLLMYCALAALLFMIDGLWSKMAHLGSGGAALIGQILSAASAAALGALESAWRLIRWPTFARSASGTGLNKSRSASRARRSAVAKAAVATLEIEEEEEEDEEADIPEADSPAPLTIRRPAFRKPVVDAAECYPTTLDDWVLPPISLLEEVECSEGEQQESEAREKAKTLEQTLRDFKIEAPVVEIQTGPVITMFQLKLAPGTKVSQIAALANDLARALRAPAVRVVATIAGKNTIGIEVPRLKRDKVRLRELMTTSGKKAQSMALPLFLGKDASGSPMVYDLAKMPHLLIAGTTGSGKSVCINSIIMSLLMTQRPDRVKMILVDPKMVELSSFKDLPHLMCPIITDVQKAEKILQWACEKMDERYSLLAEAGVRNIAGYNALGEDELVERFNPAEDLEKAKIPKFLPYVVIIIDELADLMMTSGKEVEYHLARLAQKSRAVGLHIVVATQRPEAKVVTGLIKSNMPCRCAFRVAARMDSRIVLDQNGAEVLMGQGDMLFLPPGSATLLRAQGTFIEDAELKRSVSDLRGKGACDFHPELMTIRNESNVDAGERDELFNDAVKIVLDSTRGSVSLLQRRLTIGYSRASRLIDQMSAAGIVGEYKGSQAREVLMTADEWESLRQQVELDLQDGYEADQDTEDDESTINPEE